MANGLNMHELAKEGAVIKLQALEQQVAFIRKAFPDLNGHTPEQPTETQVRRAKRTWGMSAKSRKAQSIRMKEFWRARRQANQGRKSAHSPS